MKHLERAAPGRAGETGDPFRFRPDLQFCLVPRRQTAGASAREIRQRRGVDQEVPVAISVCDSSGHSLQTLVLEFVTDAFDRRLVSSAVRRSGSGLAVDRLAAEVLPTFSLPLPDVAGLSAAGQGSAWQGIWPGQSKP